MDPAGLLGVGTSNTSDTLLHLSPAERDGPCHLLPLRGSPGGCVGGLVALDAHMAGYQVESRPLPLCSETLQAAQGGGDAFHVVVGMALLEDLQPHCPPGVSVQHNGGLLTVLGVLPAQLDGHQLRVQRGAAPMVIHQLSSHGEQQQRWRRRWGERRRKLILFIS